MLSYGNRFVVKETEVEAMRAAGTWAAWLDCCFCMAGLFPQGGELSFEVVSDERGALKSRALSLEEIRQGVAA